MGTTTHTMATTAAFWNKLTTAQALKTLPRVISSGQGAHLTIEGRPYLNFCSSHYLGFAEEPRLKKAAQDAIELYGLGTGYRTLAGTHALHIKLEESIARFKGTEGAVCFASAYAANASAVQTIMGKEDIIVSDQLNHASIIDAVKVSGVKNKFAYLHSDMSDLESKLIKASELQKTPKANGEHPNILIITDGVFSMTGTWLRCRILWIWPRSTMRSPWWTTRTVRVCWVLVDGGLLITSGWRVRWTSR